MDNGETIRARILAEAEMQGISLSELARRAHMSESRIRMWKTKNGREIGHLSFGRMVSALGKSMNWAYGCCEDDVEPKDLQTDLQILEGALRLLKTRDR